MASTLSGAPAKQNPTPAERQQAAIADATESSKNTLSRAFSGSASPRGAIKAFCLQCVGYVRSDITNCTAHACALHAYRPYQAGDETEGGA